MTIVGFALLITCLVQKLWVIMFGFEKVLIIMLKLTDTRLKIISEVEIVMLMIDIERNNQKFYEL